MIPLARRPDWLAQLTRYLEEARRLAFDPGAHDCALFAAGAVWAMTGVDLARAWRGTYSTLDEGLALLRAEGVEDHVELVGRLLPEIAPIQARIGDLVAVLEGNHLALGVCGGSVVHVLGVDGGGVVEMERGVKAWRV